MTPEDKFILDFIPVLKSYLNAKNIDFLDADLDRIQSHLDDIQDESSVESLVIEITMDELTPEIQEFIIGSYGCDTKEELFAENPHLEGVLGKLKLV